MVSVRPGALLLLALLSVGLAIPVPAQGPDDPFYDWDLERYRLLRAPDDPTGGILPLPDRSSRVECLQGRSSALRFEAAEAAGAVPAWEGDGRRIREGARGRLEVDGLVPFPFGLAAGLAGRLVAGDGRRSGGEWLERNLFWTVRRTELRVGLTRSFWGDGSTGGLLLGRTAPPLELVRVRSTRPWRIPRTGPWGRIHGSLFVAYLDDRHRDVPFPLLQGTRLEWEPTDWFRVSATRTILLGGAGRTEKLTPGDLWDIWWARNENLVGERPASDTDQKASFGVELRLPPPLSPFPWLQGARFYFEYAGEDAFEGILPTAVAHLWGGSIATAGWLLLCEFTETTDDANWWYTNHTVYGRESYFFRRYLLGHPIGPDGRFGQLRVWTPTCRGFRAQIWARSLGHWDRRTDETPWWEDGLGLLARQDLRSGPVIEGGLELFHTRGDLADPPAPPVRWRLMLAIRTGPWPDALTRDGSDW